MQTIQITQASTAELVAFYNANAARVNPDATAIKKFADRKTAEKRVSDLVEKLAAHFPTEEIPEGHIQTASAPETTESAETDTNAGAEGAADEEPVETEEEKAAREAKEAQRAANGASAFNALQGVLSAMQNAPQTPAPTPSARSTSKAANSEGVAATWADSKVREARLKRDGVKVEQDGKLVGIYKSTRDAFRANRLPDNKHIRFRLKLKEAHRANGGSETFDHNGKKFVFTIVEVDAE
jgi:hypothetical protein